MLTDPIADMLTRIRNASSVLHAEVSIPKSRIKESIANILKDEGYVNDVTVDEKNITIALKYSHGRSVITGLKRISTPGRRVYVNSREIPRVQNGLGICILSTSHGVMDGMTATTKKVGGELLCAIW